MKRRNCTIRRAAPSDAELLANLAARTFHDTFAQHNRAEDMAAHVACSFGPDRQLAEITSVEIFTFMAICDEPVAFAQLRHGATPSCVTSARPMELWRFYVEQAWHGLGIAGCLMEAVLAQAVAAGATALWLGVWEHNSRAIAFYRKYGFADVGAHEFYLGFDVQTDRIMVRNLASSPTASS